MISSSWTAPSRRLPVVTLEKAIALAAIALFLLTGSCAAPATGDQHPLEGIWGGRLSFGPDVRGELVVELLSGDLPAGELGTATIAGSSTPVTDIDGELRFELPDQKGSFRGHLAGNCIDGHWTQAFTPFLGQLFATPVHLIATEPPTDNGARRFSGSVRPLDDDLHLYLSLQRESADSESEAEPALTGFFRNPERNIGIFLRFDHVELEGGQALFVDQEGETVTRARLLDANGDPATRNASGVQAIEIPVPWNDQLAIRLERKTALPVPGFHPHAETTYDYRIPERSASDDDLDWPVADAASQHLDPNRLASLIAMLRAAPVDSVATPYIHSLLVARSGHLVLEEYFYQHDRELLHDTRSAGKSFTSVLVGAAVDRSRSSDSSFTPPLTAETRLVEVFGAESPEPANGYGDDAPTFEQRQKWRNQMTLSHLLSMSSGLACDDDDPDSPGNEGSMQNRDNENGPVSWRAVGLALPMAREPGTRAIYCSNSINLAASAVARATDRWLPELFGDWLATPLGIDHYAFNLSPDGDGYMGGGLRLTARDQLKFAQLMLDDGVWRGQRVLSEEWVTRSTSPHGSIHEPDDYGLGWWRKTLEVEGRPYRVFYASGNGGQLIIGIPELDLAVQFSAGNYMNFPVWIRFLDELVPQYIIPAAL